MILTVTKANGEKKELKFKKEKVSDIEIKSLLINLVRILLNDLILTANLHQTVAYI